MKGTRFLNLDPIGTPQKTCLLEMMPYFYFFRIFPNFFSALNQRNTLHVFFFRKKTNTSKAFWGEFFGREKKNGDLDGFCCGFSHRVVGSFLFPRWTDFFNFFLSDQRVWLKIDSRRFIATSAELTPKRYRLVRENLPNLPKMALYNYIG